MELKDKLFHGIKAYNCTIDQERLNLIRLKLERVIITGKILRRKDLETLYKDNNCCRINYNCGVLISLSKHKSAWDENDKSIYVNDKEDDSWDMYPENEICLVLNKDLLNDNIIELNYMRCPLELQVRNPIDLKYLEAISIPSMSLTEPFFKDDCDIEECLTHYHEFPYNRLNMVLEVLNKYGIKVPIVDIKTGNEYRENLEYRNKIKELLHK